MHQSSFDKMVSFRQRHLQGREREPLRIVDVGSFDVNGSYRPIFNEPAWHYSGVDMSPGPNVDIVLSDPYCWRELPSGSADVLISGQAFEHMTQPWTSILEVARVLAPGGLCCIVAPASGPEHRYPRDCWRIFQDGFVALADFASLEVIEAVTQWEDLGYPDGSDVWHDSMLVARRPERRGLARIRAELGRRVRHWAITTGSQRPRP